MKKNLSTRASLLGTAVMVVALAAFCIYGFVYDYFDTAVCIGLVLAAVCAFAYTRLTTLWSEYLNLLSVVCVSFSVGLFFLNSYPVWADRLNHITMYASRGTLVPVVAIMLLMFLAIAVEAVSCFTNKEG